MRRGGLRRLLLAGFLVNSAVAIGAAALLARVQVQLALEQLAEETFGPVAEELGFNVGLVLSKTLGDVRVAAGDPLLSDPEGTPERKREELIRLKRMLGAYQDLTLVDLHGDVLASSDYNFRGAWKHKRHFVEAAAGRTTISSAHFIPYPNRPILSVAGPVTDHSGRPVAVVALQLDLYEIVRIVQHARIGGTGHALLIDGYGRYLSHPDGGKLLTLAPPELVSRIEDASGLVELPGPAGRPYLGVSQQLSGPAAGWRVVVLQERDELFGILDTMTWLIAGFAAVLFAAAIFVAHRFAESITTPVRHLIEGARRIGRGDFAHRVEVSAVDEIADLAESFNHMARELDAAQTYLGLVFDSLPTALISISPGGTIFHWSRATERMTGLPAGDVVGEDVFRFAPFLEPYRKAVEEAMQTREARVFRRQQVSLEGERTVDLAIFPLVRSGVGAVIRVEDMTEQELRDAELLQAQKMEIVGSLAGGLSHDFNNALAAIIGMTSLLRHLIESDAAGREELIEKLGQIESAAGAAASTVERLLSFTRPRKGFSTVFDLNDAARQTADICRSTFGRQIEVRVLAAPEPALVRGDPGQIQQALLNLCVNAEHAMTVMREPGERRGGLLEITVAAQGEHDRGFHAISVRDTGVGMEPAIVARVFEPFFTTKGQGKGTGLGLAMVRDIAAGAGGTVAVRSEPGRGSTFELRLPAVAATAEPSG